MLRRLLNLAFLPTVMAVLPANDAAAQACVGLPTSAPGSFRYGFEGTDAADGYGFAASIRGSRAGLEFGRKSLNHLSLADDVSILTVRGSWQLFTGVRGLCLLAGAERTSYLAAWNWFTSVDETGQRTDELTVDGNFDRYRFPVGLGLGQSFRLSESVDLYPFVTSTLVLEHERFERRHDVFQLKTRPALGTEAGLGITMGRIMLRSTVSHVWTSRNALTGLNNFPYLSVHVGFVF
jgi:hypothetical protein